jgi:hypothetical protein
MVYDIQTQIFGIFHPMYRNIIHYILGTGLVPVFRLTSSKTSVTTWQLFALQVKPDYNWVSKYHTFKRRFRNYGYVNLTAHQVRKVHNWSCILCICCLVEFAQPYFLSCFWNVWYLPIWSQSGFYCNINNEHIVTVVLQEVGLKVGTEPLYCSFSSETFYTISVCILTQ